MLIVARSSKNPVLSPEPEHAWEAEAAHNPSVVRDGAGIHCVYRAVSKKQDIAGVSLEVSSLGYAVSRDGIHFKNRRQLFGPEKEWERFGCEDPRITAFEGAYYIFYTALSTYPFSAEGIKIGVAVTKDFTTFEKHLVTPFNAKAMALFPERVGGKIAVVLTAHTDIPPAKVCLALLDDIRDVWSESYWQKWHEEIEHHVLPIGLGEKDQIEVGAAPLKTEQGWLLIYSYIYNYFSPPAVFGVQAVLLDAEHPSRIIGEVKRPFLVPIEEYERYGRVPNIVFPSGAFLKNKKTYLYYGAADTTSCVAMINTSHLLEELVLVKKRELNRFEGNPIIEPIAEHPWESKATFNPAAVYEEGKVHILYRAMSDDNTSVVGYASSVDGFNVSERLAEPVYVPREEFERKRVPGGNSGCEDPRLTRIGDTMYMCYTAFDGRDPPRVALTSISCADLLARRWNWTRPMLISPPGMDDKDAALFPKKINGKYAVLHRLGTDIWIDFVDDLLFRNNTFLGGKILMSPRETSWDSKRIGIAGPPIETEAGWLILYHGISRRTNHYSVRAVLLDRDDPTKILYRTHDPIFEPKMPYEKNGVVPNVVFPCGAVVMRGELLVYYGGGDRVVGVASVGFRDLVESLAHKSRFHKK